MFRRLIFYSFLIFFVLWVTSQWRRIPAGIQSIESLLKPVFHKGTINWYAGIYKEDPLFISAIIKVESNFLRKAKSYRGAIGLMQIMPNTAKEIARELKIKNFEKGELENPEVNIHFGFHYLSKLRKEFGDDDKVVLAAYNAGRKNVKEWLKKNKEETLSLNEIEFAETRMFVQEVLSTYRWLKRVQKWRNQVLGLFKKSS